MTDLEKERLSKYMQFTDEELLQLPKTNQDEFKYLAKQDEATRKTSNEDLYSKALQVGYSGLSNEEKSKLDYSYTKSEASKSKSLDQVHAEMDANAAASKQMAQENIKNDPNFKPVISQQEADARDENTGNAYTLARNVISTGFSPIGAAVEHLWNKVEPEHKLVDGAAIPVDKSYIERTQDFQTKANNGEGVPGFVSDPLNFVGGALPLAKSTTWTKRGGLEALKGGALAGAYDVGNEQNDNILRDVAIGSVLGGIGGSILNKPVSRQAEQEADALRTFPGDKYLKTQANKGSEIFEPMSAKEKKQILESIPAPYDKEAWIRHYESIASDAKAGYSAVNEIAKNAEANNLAYVPMNRLKENMKKKMLEGVGNYSKEDVENFVDKKLSGFIDKYGPNGKVPIHELGNIKGKFAEDIFDPRFSVAEGTQTKRALARKAGDVIEKYRNESARYFPNNEETQKIADQFHNFPSEENYKKLLMHLMLPENKPVSYNELLEMVSPGTKQTYKKQKALEEIFQHQPEFIGSKREGKGILGKLFEGATHVYSPAGNAYVDPVKLLKASQSKIPERVGKIGVTGGYKIGSMLYGNDKKK